MKITVLIIAFLAIGLSVLSAQSGDLGGGVTWQFSGGTLTIRGTGPMPVSFPASVPPWLSVRNQITTVVIEDGVTSLPNGGFAECPMLTQVTIGRGVTELPGAVFARSGITSITIPEQIVYIDLAAFDGANRLETLYFNAANCADFSPMLVPPLFHNTVTPALKTVVIGSTVRKIPDYLLTGASMVTSLTINSGVTAIGRHAFRDCIGLTNIVLPDSVTSIGNAAFSGCRALASVTLGSEIIIIGNGAFADSGITEITIPQSITTVEDAAFSGCTRLRRVYWNAATVNDFNSTSAQFRDCNVIEEIIIGDNVRQIPAWAFHSLPSLEKVTIGSRVTSIGNRAFSGCDALMEIISRAARPPQLGSMHAFYGLDQSWITLEVPNTAQSINAYKSAEVWKDFQFNQ
ncbi:MAG: leucine-rich repeat domain-containing protein [Treponema sp.]|nr:leucine-rich repeat domain-containing protein [Treponema sp.]